VDQPALPAPAASEERDGQPDRKSPGPAVVTPGSVRWPLRVLWQEPEQVDFERRRFRLRPGPARGSLEEAGRAFLTGYNGVLAAGDTSGVAAVVDGLPADRRGFAAEGAGMGTAVLDLLTLSRGRRTRALLESLGDRYVHLIHVGVGWAHARLRLHPWRGVPVGDPLLRWLAWDGYGFHQAFFHSDRVVGARHTPRRLAPPVVRIVDQGLGRALWFHECADVTGVSLRIAGFPATRQADLWSGIGLAATYAGGADPDELAWLADAAGPYREDLAQGSAFACRAHLQAGHLPPHTAAAAPVLAGAPAQEAAGWSDAALREIGTGPYDATDYQRWRGQTRARAAQTRAAQKAAQVRR